jgi:uncharacterized Fe-S cluster-containing protein
VSLQINRVYAYLADAYKQDFGLDPAGNEETCRRLEEAAMQAVALYHGRFIDDAPIEIIVPYAHVVDVLRPQSLKRTLSRAEFRDLVSSAQRRNSRPHRPG